MALSLSYGPFSSVSSFSASTLLSRLGISFMSSSAISWSSPSSAMSAITSASSSRPLSLLYFSSLAEMVFMRWLALLAASTSSQKSGAPIFFSSSSFSAANPATSKGLTCLCKCFLHCCKLLPAFVQLDHCYSHPFDFSLIIPSVDKDTQGFRSQTARHNRVVLI